MANRIRKWFYVCTINSEKKRKKVKAIKRIRRQVILRKMINGECLTWIGVNILKKNVVFVNVIFGLQEVTLHSIAQTAVVYL